MSLYLIGDVQGCDDALSRLLAQIGFSASRDSLVLLGDLVNRGPDSLAVLRRVIGFGAAARCVLGNHDLHLLALAHGVRPAHAGDSLGPVLDAPDRAELLDWIRQQPLALLDRYHGRELLMVHAGVLPSWSARKTVALAGEVQQVLRGPSYGDFLQQMYGNTPDSWHDELRGVPRLRTIVNVLTRLRFCTPDDGLELTTKEGAGAAPAGYWPWFDAPGRKTADTLVAFGHWSTLGRLDRRDVLSLDTGCVWGGQLSAVHLTRGALPGELGIEWIQVPCTQARRPGI